VWDQLVPFEAQITGTVWAQTDTQDIRKITEADGDAFRIFLLSKPGIKEENTVRKHIQIAKQYMNHAVKRKLIAINPFAHLASAIVPNKERFFYIDDATSRKVLEACPDIEWRTIFALCRFAGLRSPSEVLELKWSDINWEVEEMLVRSEKTEHHTGMGSRIVPIFMDLLPILEKAFDAAEEGSEYVINRYRSNEANLRTQLTRIVERAGVVMWPKAFQNLRSSLATDLIEFEALHVVAEWTGHTVETLRKFYLQVTKKHQMQAKRRMKKARLEEAEAKAKHPSEAESSESHRKPAKDRASQDTNPKQSSADTRRNTGAGETGKAVLSINNSACPKSSSLSSSRGGTRTRTP